MAEKSLLDLLDELTPEVRRAFLKAIENVRSDFQERAFTEAFERRDVEGALRAIGLGAEYFAPLERALNAAFLRGGEWLLDEMRRPAKRAGIEAVGRFDMRNPRAEQLVRQLSADLIVEIAEGQRESIRIALEEGMREGVSANRSKLDIIGRSPARGLPRQGGIVGLTSQQAGYVQNMRSDLLSGDPSLMEGYFDRKRRDRRFDAVVRRAIAAGKPVSRADAERIAARYADRLLQLRGETIARTELLTTLHAAQDEGLEQMIGRGVIERDAVMLTWDASEDKSTRSSHRAMDGQTRQKGQPFTSGNGYSLMRPGDRSMGAPASETINCRCRLEVDVDFLSGLNFGD